MEICRTFLNNHFRFCDHSSGNHMAVSRHSSCLLSSLAPSTNVQGLDEGKAKKACRARGLRRAWSPRAGMGPALEKEASNFMPWEPHFPLLNPDPENTGYCSST